MRSPINSHLSKEIENVPFKTNLTGSQTVFTCALESNAHAHAENTVGLRD